MGKRRRKRISCPNCDTQLREEMNYCFSCGQENHIKRVSMKMLSNDFISTYFSADSKLLASLKYLIFKPSFLSLEYLNGKIEAYLRPIRLYVFISFSFFLLLGITSTNIGVDNLNLKKDGNPVTFEEVSSEINSKKQETSISDDSSIFDLKMEKIFSDKREANLFLNHAKSKLPILLFIIIPILALLLYLFFYHKEYYYIDHLVFALHLQSFFFVLLILTTIVDWIFNTDLSGLAVLGLLIYGFIAARRFYKRKKVSTFLRLSLVGLFHSIISVFVGIAFFLILLNYYNV